jgi:hypothetical protein
MWDNLKRKQQKLRTGIRWCLWPCWRRLSKRWTCLNIVFLYWFHSYNKEDKIRQNNWKTRMWYKWNNIFGLNSRKDKRCEARWWSFHFIDNKFRSSIESFYNWIKHNKKNCWATIRKSETPRKDGTICIYIFLLCTFYIQCLLIWKYSWRLRCKD